MILYKSRLFYLVFCIWTLQSSASNNSTPTSNMLILSPKNITSSTPIEFSTPTGNETYNFINTTVATITEHVPDIPTLYKQIQSGVASYGKFSAAATLYKKIKSPMFCVFAHDGIALTTILFGPDTNVEKIMQYASDRLVNYGALTLNAYAAGATQEMLAVQNNRFDMYIKPLVVAGTGIIGLTLVSSSIPIPLIAESAKSGFYGMTVTGGINIAKNLIAQGAETAAIKKVTQEIKNPESTLIRNGIIVAGTLGVIAFSPLLLTYAGAVASSAVATNITTAMALNAALDITKELSTAATYDIGYSAGKKTVQNSTSVWQDMQDFVSWILHQAVTELDLSLLDETEHNNYSKVQELLAEGANPNVTNYRGSTPLMINVGQGGDPRITDILLEHNAHVNAQDNEGETALMKAVQAVPQQPAIDEQKVNQSTLPTPEKATPPTEKIAEKAPITPTQAQPKKTWTETFKGWFSFSNPFGQEGDYVEPGEYE